MCVDLEENCNTFLYHAQKHNLSISKTWCSKGNLFEFVCNAHECRRRVMRPLKFNKFHNVKTKNNGTYRSSLQQTP